jgi:hypothetical protein
MPTPPQHAAPLSAETESQVRQHFAPQDHAEVRTLLLQYGTSPWQRETERVRFDILHLAAGRLEAVQSLVNLALRDYRDVLSAEYPRVDGRSVPRPWAMRHSVNCKSLPND